MLNLKNYNFSQACNFFKKYNGLNSISKLLPCFLLIFNFASISSIEKSTTAAAKALRIIIPDTIAQKPVATKPTSHVSRARGDSSSGSLRRTPCTPTPRTHLRIIVCAWCLKKRIEPLHDGLRTDCKLCNAGPGTCDCIISGRKNYYNYTYE